MAARHGESKSQLPVTIRIQVADRGLLDMMGLRNEGNGIQDKTLTLGCAIGFWVYNPYVHNPTHKLCPRGQKPNLTYGFCVQPIGTQIYST